MKREGEHGNRGVRVFKPNLSSKIYHLQGKLNHRPGLGNVLTNKVPCISGPVFSAANLLCVSSNSSFIGKGAFS